MISEQISLTDDWWTEGFETTANGLEIQVTAGRIVMEMSVRDPETGEYSDAHDITNYPDFSFDIEPDSEFSVIYDAYLLELPSLSGEEVVIDRTVMTHGAEAYYEGTDRLKFTLMSFAVQPNSVDLENTNIVIKKVVKRNEENTSQ